MGFGANYFRGGELECLEYWQYFESIVYAASTRISTSSTLLIRWVFQPFRMIVERVLLVLEVLYYLSYSQYSQCLGLQYSYCSYSQHVQSLGHHVLDHCDTLSTSSIQSLEPRNNSSTGSLRKSIHTNMYHAAPSCTDTPTYSSITSSIWSTAVVPLLGIKQES